LQLGADDYMTKPFWPRNCWLESRHDCADLVWTPGTLEIGPLHIDLDERRVWVGGGLVELTRVEFDILAASPADRGRR